MSDQPFSGNSDCMDISPPSSIGKEKKKYLIKFQDIESYEETKKILDGCNSKLLNNYDGTFNFIIECTEDYASFLRKRNINLISDQRLYFDIPK